MFKDFCHQVGTKVFFASVYHPQSNGVVEWANALIFEAIKKILNGVKKDKLVEVMQRAVWNHNTTVYKAANFTTFWLLFGAEAVLPEEIKHQSLRTTAVVLMTKFGRAEKIWCSSFLFWIVWFWQFQGKTKELNSKIWRSKVFWGMEKD
jgi:hypothetical protein